MGIHGLLGVGGSCSCLWGSRGLLGAGSKTLEEESTPTNIRMHRPPRQPPTPGTALG